MEKVFYVCDSYSSEAIASTIREVFPDAIVYTDSTIASITKGDPKATAANMLQKLISEPRLRKDKIHTKVDYFLFSAKLIYDGSIEPRKLKRQYGSVNAKTIAISMEPEYFKLVRKKVDHTEMKSIFTKPESLKKYFG